jgi:hypothetical protein
MPDSRPLRLAVLIDADNTSAKIVDGLFEEIAKLGEATVRRVYGDFASPRSKGWTDVLARHAIIPQQQFAYTSGKNASDITLVIDAMDLLHTAELDGFCLVSSDSDFTRLASRLREAGAAVYGFGAQKTPESFRQACKRFIYTENLVPAPPSAAGARAGATTVAREPLANAATMIQRVIGELDSDCDGGWIGLGHMGQQLSALAPDFDARTYGFKKLSDLVRAIETLEVRTESGNLRVRVRPEPPRPPKVKKKAKG